MKTLQWTLGALLLCGAASLAQADDGCCSHKSKDCGPGLKKECVYENPKCEFKKKPCWDIQKVDICIPRPKLPWQCCDEPPKCRVRCVKVPVKKDKDTCCEVKKWTCKVYETCDDSCGKKGKGCCGDEHIIVVPAGPEKLPVNPKPVDPKQ